MVDNPKDFDVFEYLKDGMQVTIRAVRPDDKDRINEAFQNLEPETIYTRFFQHKNYLSDQELKRATEPDFENDVGVVVTIEQDGREVVIGGARYSLLRPMPNTPASAEVAFTVEEDYQGKGMAKLLLNHLADLARSQGIKIFEAEVLPQNSSMLYVFQRSGFEMEKHREDGSIHVLLSI